METLLTWMVLIPMFLVAAKFWIGVAKWGLKNKRDIGRRVQRVRSAYEDSMREFEPRADQR